MSTACLSPFCSPTCTNYLNSPASGSGSRTLRLLVSTTKRAATECRHSSAAHTRVLLMASTLSQQTTQSGSRTAQLDALLWAAEHREAEQSKIARCTFYLGRSTSQTAAYLCVAQPGRKSPCSCDVHFWRQSGTLLS